jgi:SAM-dependent methyltransferase
VPDFPRPGDTVRAENAADRPLRRVGIWATEALLLPRVAWIASRTAKDPRTGWERYWGKVRATGASGDVLWDSADLDEVPRYLDNMQGHVDFELPILDLGCGNGRFLRRLAPAFRSGMGIDVSKNAVARARLESTDSVGLMFVSLDGTSPEAGDDIRGEIGGDANVFIRGVLHVLDPDGRAALARTAHTIVGRRGRVFLAETNFQGTQLGYVRQLGATLAHIPRPLARAISDLPRPGHFGRAERVTAFPDAEWSVIADGPTDIQTIPLSDSMPTVVPGYFALLAPKHP